MARQSVQHHLAKLMEAGLVKPRESKALRARTTQEYFLNHAQLFAIVDELRRVCDLKGLAVAEGQETLAHDHPASKTWLAGPKLVLVHGVGEGRAYPLESRLVKPPRGWIIGRGGSSHVALDYDPFISVENTEIVRSPKGFQLIDLRTSRNGTRLNWETLTVGGEAPLRHGDVIGVGASLLLFRED